MNPLRSLISAVPTGRSPVARLVAGERAGGTTAVVAAVERLEAERLCALVEHTGEEPRDTDAAEQVVQTGLRLCAATERCGTAIAFDLAEYAGLGVLEELPFGEKSGPTVRRIPASILASRL